MKEQEKEKTLSAPSHTPEPWAFEGLPTSYPWLIVPSNGSYEVIAKMWDAPEHNEANAKRIVSCVNALAGIANPDAVGEVIKEARKVVNAIESGERFGHFGLLDALAALEETK